MPNLSRLWHIIENAFNNAKVLEVGKVILYVIVGLRMPSYHARLSQSRARSLLLGTVFNTEKARRLGNLPSRAALAHRETNML